AVLVVV
ncbi:hypothetical protein MKD33_02865, partial [Chromobacterium piscinae]